MAGTGNNAYQQVATGMQNAGTGLQSGIDYTPMNVSATTVTPNNVSVQDRNMDQYLNPYTQNVIDNTMSSLGDANKIAQQQIADQADAQNAFGGSRFGVQQGIQNAKFGELATNMASKLNEANYNQALQNSNFDITTGLNADLANQTAGLNAGLANQSTNLQAGLANQGAGLTANQQGIGASSGLGALANLGFNQTNTLNNQQAQQGAFVQALNQAILDGENAQVEGYLNQPYNALQTLLSGVSPITATAPSSSTQKRSLTLWDWLTGLGEATQGMQQGWSSGGGTP